jgi:hypothetical protein
MHYVKHRSASHNSSLLIIKNMRYLEDLQLGIPELCGLLLPRYLKCYIALTGWAL